MHTRHTQDTSGGSTRVVLAALFSFFGLSQVILDLSVKKQFLLNRKTVSKIVKYRMRSTSTFFRTRYGSGGLPDAALGTGTESRKISHLSILDPPATFMLRTYFYFRGYFVGQNLAYTTPGLNILIRKCTCHSSPFPPPLAQSLNAL